MPNLKLSYFDFDGGRGEAVRLAMILGKIRFEDDRIPPATWGSVREETPFHALPVLHVDGEAITQSNAMLRFVGRMAGLSPEDPLEALRCDEAMDAVEDILTQIVPTFWIQDEDAKRAAREKLAKGPISLYLSTLEQKLVAGGGEHFADGRLTIADLKVCVWVQSLCSGILDYVPTDLAERVGPHLVSQNETIRALPEIAAYYSRHG